MPAHTGRVSRKALSAAGRTLRKAAPRKTATTRGGTTGAKRTTRTSSSKSTRKAAPRSAAKRTAPERIVTKEHVIERRYVIPEERTDQMDSRQTDQDERINNP